ncbi:cation diffusion facilitator family transporter [Marinobacterium jannaschii]|uniref:cation diffusion facilitator family transporter n=1 Tax=Marinobacterium jannaschii TaxID=64970 RepID=UPI000488A275|nr:cation diffusion facilitator family transporter [Marinobacterium jannaschii]
MERNATEQKAAEKVTLIGAVIDAFLGALKVVVGTLSHSSALIADGIHSLSDLLTDLLVVVVIRISGKEADKEHPWGHGRFETVGTVILGSVLIAIAGAMGYENAVKLFQGEPSQTPQWPALLAAAISIGAKEWIYHYTRAIGEKLKSDLLIANAWHSRTDALSSIVVLAGVAGAMMGIWWLDAVAALAVSLLVAKIGWSLTWDSIKELVDTALPAERVTALKEVIMDVEGVLDVHSFKSRKMAGRGILEMHLQVKPGISASEGHYIGDSAVCNILQKFDDIAHIIFHIDTYNDESDNYCKTLPMRPEVSDILSDRLSQIDTTLTQWSQLTLHYSDKIEIELYYTSLPGITARQLEQQLQQSLSASAPWCGRIQVWNKS